MSPAAGPAPADLALEAFRAADFNPTRQLKSIWRDVPYEVSALHARSTGDILAYFDRATREPDPVDEPRGCVVVAPAGHGKTHLMGRLRRAVWERDGWFILLDLVGVKDFWSSVALGFLNSLQVKRPDGETQYDWLILKLADHADIGPQVGEIAGGHRHVPPAAMTQIAKLFRDALARKYPEEIVEHRDVLTALILLHSDDLDQRSLAHAWLQGMSLDPQDLRPLGFVLNDNSPVKVVNGLCWFMSRVAPTLIAVDQIDAIVTAANVSARESVADGERGPGDAGAIIAQLAQGLLDLFDVKRRAVVVLSCLEATWEVIRARSTAAVTDRFQDHMVLPALPDGAQAAAIVEARLAPAYAAAGFIPPYPTWPFRPDALAKAAGLSPRELLNHCERHQRACLGFGRVDELVIFDPSGAPAPAPAPPSDDVEARYARELAAAEAKADAFLDPAREDDLRALFAHALDAFGQQLDLPADVESAVQFDPDQERPSLHGRLTFTFRAEQEREEHYCFRLLAHPNDRAFQSRIKAAMTAAGIGSPLPGRRLFILRVSEPPKGPKSQQLAAEFRRAAGTFIRPEAADVRAFLALQALGTGPDIRAWLRQRKPLFEVPLFRAAGLCPPHFLSAAPVPPVPPPTPLPPSTPVPPPPTGGVQPQPPSTAPRDIPVGRRLGPPDAGAPVALAAALLPRHVAIFAGSGSGKTVLLRRLVEEAALLGIPAIVLDINNDLARLGEAWPQVPEQFSAEDAAKAERYRASVEVVVWTPGVSSGNPLSLALLPDFAAIGSGRDAESEDERSQAVEMARATLTPYLGGGGQKANLKQGVLAGALRHFALAGGRELKDFVALLSELPEGLSEIGNAEKLAADMADQLRAAIATNPLLQSGGPTLDPGRLFHGRDPARARVSVINLAGLATDAARQAFVNQLQMTLFTWVKQNPSPSGRLYVLDEAQNFAPSQANTACKASTRSLAAQARKFGLGMVFATQLPRGIDSGIVSNCTTHMYGRMSSPATIEATRELMAAKGGAADDLARLGRGIFYFSTEDVRRPIKIETALCLTWHPANPPTAADVVKAARATRQG